MQTISCHPTKNDLFISKGTHFYNFISSHMFILSWIWCPRYLLQHFNVVCQMKKMDDSHQEATEKEVERILGYLKRYYQDDREFKVHLAGVNISRLCHHSLLMHLCFRHSNIPNIVLRVCHWPQLVFPDSGEHFPHVFSNQGELPELRFVSFELVCPLVTVSRRDTVVCVSGWFCTNVSG